MIVWEKFLLWFRVGLDRYLELFKTFSPREILAVSSEIVCSTLNDLLNPVLEMPRNVEIKARVNDLEKLEGLVYELTDSLGTVFCQEDTFFQVPSGRLKLRVVDNNPNGELIQYERSDQTGPKESQFSTSPVEDAESLKLTLSKALGVKGVVKKQRRLYMYGQTRIHVDAVSNLGSFMELEVCLEPSQTLEDGEAIAKDIMKNLEISPDDLIATAYMDLILKNSNDKIKDPAKSA